MFVRWVNQCDSAHFYQHTFLNPRCFYFTKIKNLRRTVTLLIVNNCHSKGRVQSCFTFGFTQQKQKMKTQPRSRIQVDIGKIIPILIIILLSTACFWSVNGYRSPSYEEKNFIGKQTINLRHRLPGGGSRPNVSTPCAEMWNTRFIVWSSWNSLLPEVFEVLFYFKK